MNILVVHEVDYQNKVIYEVHEFTELLAQRGHQLFFIEFPENFRGIRGSRIRPISGRVYESKIHLCTPRVINFGFLGRIFAIFSVVPLMFRVIRGNKIDVILNFAVPTYGFQALILSKLFQVPMIHRALDVSHLIRKSFWNPLIKLYERLFYRLVPSISANNPAMREWILEFSKTNAQLEVHYPPLDIQKYSNSRSLKMREKLNIPKENLVFVYMGTFFYFSGLEEVLASFACSIKKNRNQTLLLIGGGEQELELRSLVKSLTIEPYVLFTGFVEHRHLKEYVSAGDIAINPLRDSLVSNVALPHKVFQYLACGVPVISTDLKGLRSSLSQKAPVTWVNSPSEVIIDYPRAMEIVSSFDYRNALGELEFLSPANTVQKMEDFLARRVGL